MNNGRPFKSKPKKNSRLVAMEESLDVLYKLAGRDRSKDDELDEEEKARTIVENMRANNLPLDEEAADFFLPDEAEFSFMIISLSEGMESFMTSLASMKAQNFVHGYVHAQIEAGIRSKDGSLL